MDKNQPQSSNANQVRSIKSQSKPVIVMKKMEYGNNICNYTHRICLQNKLEGCDHCIRHILYDKNSLFKQCSFVHPQSHKRCPNAARKTDRKESVCPWHLKKIFIKRKQLQQNAIAEKTLNKVSTTQQLFHDLEHYCPHDHDKTRLNSNWIKLEDDSITASDHLRRKIFESRLNVENRAYLENVDDDEELNDPLVENTFRTDMIDSDSESIDSNEEEPLKHAGIYTPEEVSSILRDKMVKLQNLYVSELNHLQHLLKEKYKKYLNQVRNQQDVFQFSPFKLTLNGIQTSDDYNKLKALMRYHRYHGTEALLKQQFKDKRNKIKLDNQSQLNLQSNDSNAILSTSTNFTSLKAKNPQLCIYEKDDEKCDRKAMPLTHYCKIHILYDADQVLFRPCASGDPPCLNPVMSFQKGNTCILHEDKKEIKDICVLEDDDNTIRIDENLPISNTDNFMDVDPNSIGSLFGFDQFRAN